ncbi:MAG: hypothetical protein Q8N88_03315 [Nanoarchaeota archaeon]|nr:hypothetical protein [Nanoarchaeota archaeon]
MYQEIFNEALQQLKSIAEGVNNPWTVWVSLLGVFVALLLGVIGIFQGRIRSWFKKPKLNVSIKLEPPDCHKIAMRNPQTGAYVCDSYYFRFRVENTGNYQMEDVEAIPVELYKKINGKFEKVNNFLPLNLVWAHYHNITMPKIQPLMFKHLDFGHITKSNFANLSYFGISESARIVFQLDLAVIPNTGSHILIPGDYKIKILFAANNLKPIAKIYNIEIKDNWTDDEKEMLNNNISIKEESYV